MLLAQLSIPSNGFAEGWDWMAYNGTAFQFHRMDSRTWYAKLSLPASQCFQFHRMDSLYRVDSPVDVMVVETFNSIEWIPGLYRMQRKILVVWWLSIPSNGFMGRVRWKGEKGCVMPFNSIEWIHLQKVNKSNEYLISSLFQFHRMDS